MRPLVIISEMCDIINMLSDIVKKQQTEIERSKVEESVKEELRAMVKEAEDKMDANEYHLRRVVDTDDVENIEEEMDDD
jgi:hypothetical protein|nr:MAG TPA: hypothetical protein [Caudoviricetes sp.]